MAEMEEGQPSMVLVNTPQGQMILCYSCFHDQEFPLVSWVPSDPENYPLACAICQGVMLTDGEWQEPFQGVNDADCE